MKRVLLGGLGLALGWLASQASAQEVQWHSASPHTEANAPAAVLGRPTVAPPVTDVQVQPAAFSQEAPSAPRLLAQAKGAEVQQPLPKGPVIEGVEPLPPPKSSMAASPPAAPSADPWSMTGMPWSSNAASAISPGPDCCGEGCPVDCCPDGCCPPVCCDAIGCGNCCALPRFWGSAEYLLWRVRSPLLPPLLTTTTLSGAQEKALLFASPRTFTPGGLGQPGTVVLFGGSNLDLGDFSGGRFTIGAALLPQLGLEATFFFLGTQHESFAANSNASGFPGLFRPFTNVTPAPFAQTQAGFVNLLPVNNAETVAISPFVAGNVNINYQTRFWGAEANLRHPLLCGCDYRLDVIGGFRFIDLSESLNIREQLVFLPAIAAVPGGAGLPGASQVVTDNFGTINHFYGGQVGLSYECKHGRWIFGANGKVALGAMHQVVNINGSTVFTPAGGVPGPATPGGFLAAGTNIGQHTDDHFAVVPEVGLKLGYQLTDHLKAFVGYDFLYLSNVVRPGDQVDLNVNLKQPAILGQQNVVGGPTTITGPISPGVPFRRTDFWAQGANFGLEFTW